MTDNFDLIWNYMQGLGVVNNPEAALKTDLFFDVQLIRRGKDHPNLPAANYTFKAYYFDNLEAFDKAVDEIKKCCDMFGLRAYVSVNLKSKQEAAKKTLERYAHNIVMGEFRKPWKDFSSVCGGLEGKEKRWIIDCDNDDCDNIEIYLKNIILSIRQCESSYDDPIVTIIPTKNGFHIITHPFNMNRFKKICDAKSIIPPEIKKNHITLLYENLK
jgi:hypothetical protein